MIVRIFHGLSLQELRAINEVFERVQTKSEVFAGIHAIAALVIGSFVVSVEGPRLPVTFGGRGDGFVQCEEGGCRFETEFGDEARGVGFVVLIGGHFAVPYCRFCQYKSR
jgi:hypothetical protein